MGEFELIERFFRQPAQAAPAAQMAQTPQASPGSGAPQNGSKSATADRSAARALSRIALGIGDDCALLAPAPGQHLAISTDTLIEGRHFFADVDAARLGHKALAVNLSDLAACGARPLAFTLALALPRVDETWLQGFSSGLLALAAAHGCALIGGDTTRGPLAITLTVLGEVPPGQALLRSGAHAGDDIWVSGTLGDARLALQALQGQRTLPPDALAAARARLEAPTPRVALGLALRGIASAAADVSDGLLGDLGHILKASGVGATVDASITINLIAINQGNTCRSPVFTQDDLRAAALAGGDDYELVFTAPSAKRAAVQAAGAQAATPVTRIGQIDAAPGLRLLDGPGRALPNRFASFDHFA